MSNDPSPAPTPPADAPKYLVEGLGKQDADTLRAIARYADRFADHREADAAAELEADAVDVADTPDGWDDSGKVISPRFRFASQPSPYRR